MVHPGQLSLVTSAYYPGSVINLGSVISKVLVDPTVDAVDILAFDSHLDDSLLIPDDSRVHFPDPWFDKSDRSQLLEGSWVLNRARKGVERGEHRVVVISSLTRLARKLESVSSVIRYLGNFGKQESGGILSIVGIVEGSAESRSYQELLGIQKAHPPEFFACLASKVKIRSMIYPRTLN